MATSSSENKNKKSKNKKSSSRLSVPVRQIRVLENITENNFGDLGISFFSSVSDTNRNWKEIKDLEKSLGENVWVRVRIHRIRKKSNKMAFFFFREGLHTFQGVLYESPDVTRDDVKYCSSIPTESVVDVYGKVEKSETEIKSTFFKNIELVIHKLFVVSASLPNLPFQLDDASNKFTQEQNDDKNAVSVHRSMRLDYRFIDARSEVTNSIFKIQSGVCRFFREYLTSKGFTEIHTPKIVAGVSEGGADVFKLDYFGKKACLAQSPQLFKQMAVSCDLGRVFEVGPVFRAENANTHRHLSEFVGLDIEMPIFEHYNEILDISGDLIVYIFDRVKENFSAEIETIRRYSPCEELLYPRNSVVIRFSEAVALLESERARLEALGESEETIVVKGAVVDPFADFTTPNEKLLGALVREKYSTDFFIVSRYPAAARPFYTMPASDDPRYTNSFDFFLRGEEITSGAQRIHDYELLSQKALEKGIDLATIREYLESFRYGMRPHGGIGIGLERLVMLFLGVDNVRECSLFPRDCKRLSP